ncbi:MAG: hypothetical protein WCT53_06000 [Candidatus Gracilibacteria bacterium]|jgi:hypothetical protein
MKNFDVHNKGRNAIIIKELRSAKINIVVLPTEELRAEKQTFYGVIGRLGNFTFIREFSYFTVTGLMPLAVANEIYADPTRREDIRVEGISDVVEANPEEWAAPTDEAAQKEFIKLGLDPVEVSVLDAVRLCKEGKITAPRFIREYRIDTQAGLNFFAAILRKHGLVE